MSDHNVASSDDVSAMLVEYKRSAEDWDAASGNAKRANRLFDENHRLYKRLRDVPEGRMGIAAMFADSNPGVRLLAATHSLAWKEADAVAVLKELEQGGGLHAVTARHTLRGHLAGRLNLDW